MNSKIVVKIFLFCLYLRIIFILNFGYKYRKTFKFLLETRFKKIYVLCLHLMKIYIR